MRVASAALLLVIGASPALAQRAPVIVIPGRLDVPVVINGVDVSWAVIEGEFGLDRPGEMTPTVIYWLPPPPIVPYYRSIAYEPNYFPRSGKRPGYGRLERVPPADRPLPPPAPSFRQGWSSQSMSVPVTVYPPNMMAPYVAPVVVTPGGRVRREPPRGGAPQAPRNEEPGND